MSGGAAGGRVRALGRSPAYLRLAWRLLRDGRAPRAARAWALLGAAYAASPLDAIPGFVPVWGQLDDLWVLLRALRAALRRLPAPLRQELLAGAGVGLAELEQDLSAVGGALRAAWRAGVRGGLRAAAWAGRAAWAAAGLAWRALGARRGRGARRGDGGRQGPRSDQPSPQRRSGSTRARGASPSSPQRPASRKGSW